MAAENAMSRHASISISIIELAGINIFVKAKSRLLTIFRVNSREFMLNDDFFDEYYEYDDGKCYTTTMLI